ncbi:MAG: universal stress protein [Hyphomicrobiaceae bacterium]
MAYKTILVHANDPKRVPSLIAVAHQIGGQAGGHVSALHVLPHLQSYGATTFGVGMFEAGMKAAKLHADEIRAAVEEAGRNLGMVVSFDVFDPGSGSVAECVISQSRVADIVVAGQRDENYSFSELLDVPERLVLDSGRPLLMVPRYGTYGAVGQRINVAWNGTKEAARAVFDAMPLLQAAGRVRIISVNPQSSLETSGDLPGADIAEALARHGVRCETAATRSAEITAADTILSGLTDDGADLLVMGAWGHSRMHERVFGGVTRHIFEHMTVPTLMSH